MSRSQYPPPMAHSPVYYEHQRTSNSSSPAPGSSHILSRPPQAHLARGEQSGLQGNGALLKTSVSSQGSGSSAGSDLKSPNTRSFRHGSHAERGLIDKTSHPHSRRQSHSTAPQGSIGGQPEMVEDRSAVIRYIQHEDMEDDAKEKDHAIWILFWLSLLDPLYSIFSCIFSIGALLGLTLLSPFRACAKGETFSTTLIRTVAPVFRKHLQLMHARSVKKAHTFDFSAPALVFVHIAAPFISLAIAFFAWVAAVFWLFTLIMGNPDGTERRDDGRATVLGARNYMEMYLLSALNNKS